MKNRSPLTVIHLILLILMFCGTIGSAANFITRYCSSVDSIDKFSNLSNTFLMFFILGMLGSGIVYLLKDYTKQAAIYYKAFLVLNVIVCALSVFIDLRFYTVNTLMIAICVLQLCKIVFLLTLALGKDLGQGKTWMLFRGILAVDFISLVLAVINMAGIGFDFSFMGYVTALIADGTIGLAIKGKYGDKTARGSH